MCARYLGFVLVLCFPGVIRASDCQPPELNGGYFVPEQETYHNSAELIYACDHGLKPAAEGWWATSKCENGKWSHNPQCIDEKACLPPAIPNRNDKDRQEDWYETQTTIQVTCEDGYELKDTSEATCINGSWSSPPVCERASSSCSAPPKISNAVVINQGYREVFAEGSQVRYHCEDGYTKVGEDTIICEAGQWTTGLTCRRIRACSAPPQISHAVIINQRHQEVFAAGSEVQYHCEDGYTKVGEDTIICEAGQWTTGPTCMEEMDRGHVESGGSGRQPSGGGGETTEHHGGSAATSGSNDRDSGPMLTNVQSCGNRPVIQNAEVVDEGPMYLKYQCNSFYKRVGPETVNCYSDGSWSQLPTCKEAFCVMDPARYARYGVKLGQSEYMQEGEMNFHCTSRDHYIHVRCTNGRITLAWCCSRHQHYYVNSYPHCNQFREPN